jgi:ribonuclease-3
LFAKFAVKKMFFAGHDFLDESLLQEALTTPSFRMDHPSASDNQRLEFLGDAVLGLLAAERLYAEHPKEKEGRLTVLRARMVSTPALAAAAERISLADNLKLGRAAAPIMRGAKVLADAVEALIGAAYLDGGLASAREVFDALELLSPSLYDGAWGGNPKGELQIRMQAMNPPRRPEYTLVSTSGKAHEPVFTVRVKVDGVGEAVSSARTRKEAEAAAASNLLENMV